MARSRTTAGKLLRLFDRAPIPVYVLDAQRRILYCNPACAQWTGLEAEKLIGRLVEYVAGDATSGPPGVAAGLCPPPEAFTGREVSAHVSCTAASGRLVHRRGRFLPLGDASEGCVGVVAFLSAVDEESLEASGSSEVNRSDRLHQELRRFRAQQASRYGLEQILGQVPAMRQVRRQIAAAAGGSRALIYGPQGSGRSHVAKAIHYAGPAAVGSIAPVECALLDAQMLHAALFAIVDQQGDSRAKTILLRDVDHLPPDALVLLNDTVLQRPSLPRIITTARAPLSELAAEGRFPSELAYELSTVVIRLPALQERIEDLPLLAQAFLERLNQGSPKQLGGLDEPALDLLCRYHWPGNLAELAETMRVAHTAAAGQWITLEDLPHRLHHYDKAINFPRRDTEAIALDEVLAQIEREILSRALARTGGNKSRAATLLGLKRARLHRRLTQLGLDGNAEDP